MQGASGASSLLVIIIKAQTEPSASACFSVNVGWAILADTSNQTNGKLILKLALLEYPLNCSRQSTCNTTQISRTCHSLAAALSV